MTRPNALIHMARQPVANRELLRELFEEHAGRRGDPLTWRRRRRRVRRRPRGVSFDLKVTLHDQRRDKSVDLSAILPIR